MILGLTYFAVPIINCSVDFDNGGSEVAPPNCVCCYVEVELFNSACTMSDQVHLCSAVLRW